MSHNFAYADSEGTHTVLTYTVSAVMPTVIATHMLWRSRLPLQPDHLTALPSSAPPTNQLTACHRRLSSRT